MNLAPRGEGIESKALGGVGGTLKGKRKTRPLSEYLTGFAELLRSFSATGLTKVKDGKGQSGETLLAPGTYPFSHGSERLLSNLSRGEPNGLVHQRDSSSPGNPKLDSMKLRTLHAGKVYTEMREGKPSIPQNGEGKVKERASKESLTQVDKGILVQGGGKSRKPSTDMTEKQSRKEGSLKDPGIPVFHSPGEGKSTISSRSGLSVKEVDPEKARGKKEIGKIVPTLLPEGKPLPEGEKGKVESNFPPFAIRLDVSVDYEKIKQQSTSTGSNGIVRETLLQQLQEKANPQIVQQAQLFLKNQEDGEIRLVLKPEQLGEVRIRLHLQDRLIEGHITVENSTVKELFEQNKGDLAQAFREQGFEMSQMEVSVGSDSHHREAEQERIQFLEAKASRMAEQVPSVDRAAWMDMQRLIDYYA
ncbi:MAG: flagellar hook-length control protein FliK [Spirochaetes bacterium]|nr:flagellar hook-length control protein FliK [Spirochaetota bacterium]